MTEMELFIRSGVTDTHNENEDNAVSNEVDEMTASVIRDLTSNAIRTFFPFRYATDTILSFFCRNKKIAYQRTLTAKYERIAAKIKENEAAYARQDILIFDVYSMKDNVLTLQHHFTSKRHTDIETEPQPFGAFGAVMKKYYPDTNQENVHTLFFNLNGNVCWSSNKENIWIWSRLHHSNACNSAKDSNCNVETYQLAARITGDCVVRCDSKASRYDALSIEAVESSVSFWKRRSIVKLVSKKTSSIVLVEDFNNAWDDWFDLDEYVDWARVLGNLIADRLNVKWIDRTAKLRALN